MIHTIRGADGQRHQQPHPNRPVCTLDDPGREHAESRAREHHGDEDPEGRPASPTRRELDRCREDQGAGQAT